MRGLLIGMAMCCVARTASAGPCTAEQPEAGVPVRIATGPADFGMLPEACAATAVSLSGRMSILIAEEDFYGSLWVAGALRARFELPGGSWLSTSLPGPEYRFVANATLEADSVDLSASTIGYHVPIVVGRLQLAPYFRFMLPSETVFQRARRLGLEHGISMVAPAGKYLEMIAGYGLPLYLTVQAGDTEAAYLPTISFDVAARPVRWFVGALGISVRAFPEEEESFESLDPRAALRFYPVHGLLIEAAGAVPVLGRDRTDGLVSLAIGWIAEPGVLSPTSDTP